MKIQNIKNFFSTRIARIVALVLITIILARNLFCYYFYSFAEKTVLQNNPENIPNRNVTEFYFAPLKLKRDGRISRNTIVEHLKSIAYQENGEGKGGFTLINNQLRINSRFPKIFPNAVVTFDKGRISSIAVDSQNVEDVLVEPFPMRTDIHFVNTDLAEKLPKDQRTRRITVKPENIPQMVKDIITSSEDYKFFENQGIDWIAIPKRMLSLNGASGISAQIAKNNFYYGASKDAFWNIGLPNSVERKAIAEPFLALALNQQMPKDTLFSAYLNMIPFGASNGIELQGIVSASQEFFGKSQLSDLTFTEICELSAMINSPTAYLNYVRNGNVCPESKEEKPTLFERFYRRLNKLFGVGGQETNKKTLPLCKNLLEKRNIVADLVYRNHPDRYSREMINEAKQAPLKFIFSSENKENRPADVYSGLFAGYALNKLPKELNHLRSEEGNIKVITSMDPQLQKAAFEISEEALRGLQPRVNKALNKQKAENPEKAVKIVNECAEQNRKNAENPQDPKCDADKLFKPQIALVAMDAQTGEILSMIGGVDTQFNFATMANRSPASTIKPFFYLKSIESGHLPDGSPITAATYIDKDVEKERLNGMCVDDEKNLGGSGSLRHELTVSSNIGACMAAESAGIPNNFVGQLLKNKPPKSLQSALGVGGETTLLNLVTAYTIFPNNGTYVSATAFKNAFQDDKRIDFTHSNGTIRTNPEATFIVTDMMKSVVEEGTAAGFRKFANLSTDIAFAGKTGSGMTSDLLFVGFTPRIVVGVWIGMDKNFPELRMSDNFTGGKVAAPIAAKFMQAVGKYRPDLLQGVFVQPQNVIKLRVNEKGCLVKAGGTEEFFISGREPRSCR